MVKKVITGIIDAVSVALIVFAVIILITVVMTKKGESPSILGRSAFRVLTGSMEPTIPVDTMVITRKVPADEIVVGDVITFYSPDPELDGNTVTHRVVATDEHDGSVWYYTKGDANPVVDEYPVSYEAVVGKVVATSMIFGKAVRLSANPLIFILFIAVPLVAILVVNLTDAVKAAKELEREELEEILEQGRSKKGTDEEALKAEIDRIESKLKSQDAEKRNIDTENENKA